MLMYKKTSLPKSVLLREFEIALRQSKIYSSSLKADFYSSFL